MTKQILRALVISDKSQIEKIPLVGSLPKSAKSPWVCIEGRHASSDKEWLILYPEDQSIPKEYGLSVDRVEFVKDGLYEVNGNLIRKVSERKAQNLAAILPLSTIPIPQQVKAQTQVLVGFSSLDELAESVQQSLTLNNSNIQYASVKQENPLGKLILRITKPSLFLLEKWISEGKKVYVNGGTPQIWVALGYQHPWVNMFSKPGFLEKVDTSNLILVSQNEWDTLNTQTFNDVFESVNVSLSVSDENTLVASEQRPKFSIPMHWGVKVQPASAEVWILEDNEQHRLENLLTVLSDSDLNNLQLAFVNSPDGEVWFIVREIISGKSKHFLNFGKAFSPYAGYTNLLLPVNRSLEPPIRRDLLASVFNLKNGELSIVMENKKAMDILRVKEYLFKPFNSLIDYLVQGAQNVIETALKRSLFDLPELNKLPSRPMPKIVQEEPKDPSPRKRGRPSKNSKDRSFEDDEEVDEFPTLVEEKSPKAQKEIVVEEVIQVAEVTPIQQTEEDLLESAAVENMTDSETWFSLAKKKYANKNFDQAVNCLETVIWICKDKTKEEYYWKMLKSWLQTKLKTDSTSVYKVRYEVIEFCEKFLQKKISSEDIATNLAEITEKLRELNSVLSKKTRWLLWSKLLGLTNDVIEVAHQRESILGELSMRGIEDKDSFSFIRRHIRQQQKNTQKLPHLQKWLNGLNTSIEKISDKNHQLELKGHVGIGIELTGDSEEATGVLRSNSKALSALSQGKATLAVAGFATLAARLSLPETEKLFNDALHHFTTMPESYEKDLSLPPLLEYIQHASLLNAEGDIMRRIFEIISKQSPRRQCLQLLDCVNHFVELGCSELVSNQALKLIAMPEVKKEFYYLEHILKALVISQAGRPIDEPLAFDILNHMLSESVKIDSNGVKVIDLALASLGDKANDIISRVLRTKRDIQALLLESCVVRSQANRGQFDLGVPSLTRLIEEAWKIPDTVQKKDCLLRLIPIIGHFGRADVGSQILMAILKKLKDGVGSFSARDQGDILIMCARTCGKLGDQERAYLLLDDAIFTFEKIIASKEGNSSSGHSALFEILVSIVDEVIALGDYDRGAALVERGVRAIESWIEKLGSSSTTNSDHPFFVHQARIKSAIALLSLDKKQRGYELLQKCLDATAQVKAFDGKDRTDLLVQALQALSLTEVSEVDRVSILDRIVTTGIGTEPSNPYNDSFRRDLIRSSIKEVVQKHTAYRLAIKKMRSLEERIVRTRITQ